MSSVTNFPPLISLQDANQFREAELECFEREAVKRRARKWFSLSMRFALARNAAVKRGDFRNAEAYAERMHRAAARYGNLMNQYHATDPNTAAPRAA